MIKLNKIDGLSIYNILFKSDSLLLAKNLEIVDETLRFKKN